MPSRAIAPAVLALTRNDDAAHFCWNAQLSVAADLPCLQGHYPGMPILAGVVQLHWAALLYRQYSADLRGVAGVTRLKFNRLIRAGDVVQLTLEGRRGANEFTFSYWCDGQRCTNGRIKLRDVSSVRHSAGV